MEPFEIMISESQERMLCVVEPRAAGRAARDLRALGGARHGDRRGHRHAAGCACSTATSWWATCRSTALVDDCPLYDLEPEAPAERRLSRPAGAARRGRRRRRDAARAARLAERGLQALRVRAVRLDRRLAHGAPPGGGRRRRAPARARRRQRRDRGLDRRQRPARGLRPVHGRRRGRARVRAQPRLRRAPSRSASPTASTSATPRSRTSPGSSRARSRACATPASRSACRWWAATCRSTTRAAEGPIYPTPVVGMVGQAARSRARAAWPASPSAGDAIALVGPVRAGARRARSSRSCAAGWPRALPAVDLASAGGRRSPSVRAAVRAGGLATAHDVSEGGLAVRAGGVLHRGRARRRAWTCRAAGARPTRCSARARAASLVAGPAPRLVERAPGRPSRSATVGGDALQIDGSLAPRGGRAARALTRARSRRPSREPACGQRRPALVASLGAGNLGRVTLRDPALQDEPRPPRLSRRASRRVRRLRRLRAGVRRRPARLLRAVRAPAPRPGVGRHRRLRRAATS